MPLSSVPFLLAHRQRPLKTCNHIFPPLVTDDNDEWTVWELAALAMKFFWRARCCFERLVYERIAQRAPAHARDPWGLSQPRPDVRGSLRGRRGLGANGTRRWLRDDVWRE